MCATDIREYYTGDFDFAARPDPREELGKGGGIKLQLRIFELVSTSGQG